MVTSTFNLTIQTSDGVSGNSPASKAVTGLSYGGSLNQYLNSMAIGIDAPTGLTATPSASGGTLAAGTYYYKVTALNAQGETIGSTEANATTTGSTGSVALSWTAVSGATSYKVYRGTSADGESVYFAASSNSFTDIGASGTAGTVPVTNGTLIWTPTLSQTPLQALYLRNTSTNGNSVSVAWTAQGGSSEKVLDLVQNAAICFLEPSAGSGLGGITAMTLTASAPGTTVEGNWTA